MKRTMATLLAVLMLFVLTAFAEQPEAALQQDLVVLFTSDVHCGVNSNWTYAGVDAIRDKLAADGNHVILVDNGDSVQGEPMGTMTAGAADIELMNKLGYEVAIPGNHEFDYGMDRFFELTQMAEFPYISCNFKLEGERVLAPYVIKEYDGVKVAFVGITTPKTLITSTPKYFMDQEGNFVYGFCQDSDGSALYAAVQECVDAARAEGASYVIAMAHLGNEDSCEPYTYADVIANTSGIDVLLDGHSHDTDQISMTNKNGEPVLRSACGTKLENVGYLRIAADGTMATGLYRWSNDESAVELLGLNSEMNAAYAEATAKLNDALSEVVAYSDVNLLIKDPETDTRIVRNQETNIGDLCADAYRYVSGADIAFVNGGGVRVSINAGPITRNDILKVHPFGNEMCVCEATGQEILDALELSASAWPGEHGGWLCPSGITFEIHTYIPSSVTKDDNGLFTGVAGEYRVKNVMIGEEPLDLERTYTLASHNYKLQNMGDGYSMFADNVFTQDCVMLDNQVLITYITQGLDGTVSTDYAEPQGRIIFVEEAPAA